MATTTNRMGLVVWSDPNDAYSYQQLADNFFRLDQHDHSPGRGAQIDTAGIKDGAITPDKLAPGSLNITPEIPPNYITTDMLKNGSVTTPKLADSAVVASKINDNSVTIAKLNPNTQPRLWSIPGVTSETTTTSTEPVFLTDMRTPNIAWRGGPVLCWFSGSFRNFEDQRNVNVIITTTEPTPGASIVGNTRRTVGMNMDEPLEVSTQAYMLPPSGSVFRVEIHWWVGNGTGLARGYQRILNVLEFPTTS